MNQTKLFYCPLYSAGTADEDCVINCPKGPGSEPEPDCDASKCCPTSAANSNGNLKQHTSKSAQNTPTTSRRPTSFHEGHEVGFFKLRDCHEKNDTSPKTC